MARRGIVLGLGNVARQSHLPAFLRGDGVAARLGIVATVDASAHVEPLSGLPHFRSLRDAMEQGGDGEGEPIDFVDICTPTASHVELTLWGLETGCHVLCEKPVALSRTEVSQIAALAGARRRVVMACHQYRYNPAWLQLRAWLDQGVVGRWHLAEFQVYRPVADGGASPAATPWRGRREVSRGGILLDHGTHLVYQLLDVAGLPWAIQAWAGRLRHRSYDVEDTAQLLLDYGDRLGTFFLTWSAHQRDTRVRFIGEDGAIEWSGGLLRREGRHGVEVLDFRAELDKRNYYQWFAGLFHRFADAMDRGETEPGLGDIDRVARVLEAAYAANQDGCRVALQPETEVR